MLLSLLLVSSRLASLGVGEGVWRECVLVFDALLVALVALLDLLAEEEPEVVVDAEALVEEEPEEEAEEAEAEELDPLAVDGLADEADEAETVAPMSWN